MLQFGSLVLSFPVIQAALSGYSDPPMRRISRRLGAEFTLCEVLLDQFVVSVSKGNKAKLYIKVEDDEHPCGAQLMGSEPDMFVAAAEKLVQAGFDLIDLNFACPVKKVLGRCRGGYLMSDPTAALDIVEKVRQSVPESIPLTIKLRRGFDDTEESARRFYALLDGAVERGIAGVTIHGRTVKQRYEGAADWNFLRLAKDHLVRRGYENIPVLGSGDLFTAGKCVERLRETKIDGLALARGIIGNPWLFREVRAALNNQPIPAPPTIAEQKDVLEEHFRLAVEFYGSKRASATLRGFGVRYAELHPQRDQVKQAFARSPWLEVVEKWYAGDV